MLNQGKSREYTPQVRRNIWTDHDWDAIAAELKQRHPRRPVSIFNTFEFTIDEFEEAMEAVIEQEHHKSFDTFSDVKRQLFSAFERMKPQWPVQTDVIVADLEGREMNTRWTRAEWIKLAIELDRIFPTYYSQRCENLRIADVHKIVEVLPASRRRMFTARNKFREKVLEIWDEIKANEAVIKKRLAPLAKRNIIAEPPLRATDDNRAMATAVHKAFQAPPVVTHRKKKVFLKPHEWVAIAKEMRRQNPHTNFFISDFNLVDLPAVRDAAREALPLDRRPILSGSKYLREPLIHAFKELWAELHADILPGMTVNPLSITDPFKAVEEAKVEVAPEPEAVKIEPAPAVVVQPEPNAIIAVAQNDFSARLVSAAMPLVNVLIGELARQIAPELVKHFAPMMAAAVEDIRAAAKAIVMPSTQQAPQQEPATPIGPYTGTYTPRESYLVTPVEKPKKPKIVVVATPGVHEDELTRAFPEYSFTFIKNNRGVKEASVNCELFLANSVSMTKTIKEDAKRYIPHDKFKIIDGGISSFKRQIHLWKAQQATQ